MTSAFDTVVLEAYSYEPAEEGASKKSIEMLYSDAFKNAIEYLRSAINDLKKGNFKKCSKECDDAEKWVNTVLTAQKQLSTLPLSTFLSTSGIGSWWAAHELKGLADELEDICPEATEVIRKKTSRNAVMGIMEIISAALFAGAAIANNMMNPDTPTVNANLQKVCDAFGLSLVAVAGGWIIKAFADSLRNVRNSDRMEDESVWNYLSDQRHNVSPNQTLNTCRDIILCVRETIRSVRAKAELNLH